MKDGEGKMLYANGTQRRGEWDYDELQEWHDLYF